MKAVVLDTDVWSFLFKRDTRAELYRADLEHNPLYVTFQTVAELYQWAKTANWGQERLANLQTWLARFTVLGYDDTTAQIWAQIRTDCARQGRPLAAQDAWVAACTLRHDYTLLTHNAADYEVIHQLKIITHST